MKLSPLTSIANNKNVQRIVNWSAKSSNKTVQGVSVSNLELVKKHFPNALTVLLSGLFVNDTIKSKDIPQDKKKSLVNFYVVNALIIIGGTYAIMPAVGRFTKRLGERFGKVNMQNTEKTVLEKGLKSMIPIVAICITSRIISPFIASYFSDKTDRLFGQEKK